MNAATRVCVQITRWVGTPVTVALFAALALVSLPGALATGSTIIIVAWVAQTFLQLVLLPLIMVGQQAQAEHTSRQTAAIVDHVTKTHERHFEALHRRLDQDRGGS